MVDTRVVQVTFFEDRAEVVRAFTCPLPRGRTRVEARGITLLVDDRSLSCKTTTPGVTIVWSRVRRRVEEVGEASAEEVLAIERERDTARARLTQTERDLESAGNDIRRTSTLFDLWANTLAAVPSRTEAAMPELHRAFDAIDSATRERLDAYAKHREANSDARAELVRLEARLEQARSKKPRYEAFAEIELVAEQDTEAAIELVYRTPCALWRPEHLARLHRTEGGAGEITITTFAAVWQRTGEVWDNVPCRFSTARPAREAMAPALKDDVLFTRKKSDVEKKQIVVEAREQTIAAAGIARGTRDVDEMPGVDDGGEAQWLTGRSPATIPSDGRPVRVEVGERKLPCSVARVCYPQLGAATHLRATATLPGPAPLLAGPITIGREAEIVGRSQVKFVSPGEPFELGFGVDDGLRVRRRVDEKRKTTQITGTQHIEREVCLFVSNLSGEARSVSIIERVPVSEIEDVIVEITKPAKVRRDNDGFTTFDLDVPARGKLELTIAYRIEAKSNVVLPASLDG